MSSLAWLLAVFAAAAALAVLGRLDQGYVQLAHGAWRVEMSLILFAVLAAIAVHGSLTEPQAGGWSVAAGPRS